MLIFCKVTKSLREFLIFSDIFKFPLQGFYQTFNQLPPGEFIPSIVRTKEEEFQDYKVITQADVLAVSDGTGMLTAHGCGAHNFVSGELQELAAALDECGNEFEIFHVFLMSDL